MAAISLDTTPAARSDQHHARNIPIPAAKKDAFNALTRPPEYALPTIALALVCIVSSLLLMYAAATGIADMVLACLGLTITFYWFFSIIHDAIHRSLSKNKWVNETVGQLASTVFNPIASLELFRWGHYQHHRHTNDDGDIDHWSHGPAWSLPLRWLTIDVHYLIRALTSKEPSAKKALRAAAPFMFGGLALIIFLIANGYGYEYLMLSVIPSRIAFLFIGFAFFWLPHAHWPNDKIDLRQSHNMTLATTVRIGHEWLLTPLLQWQNYHLIHHLWPRTPFYNNVKVWKLLEPELRQCDLAITPNFVIMPELQIKDGKAA